MALVSSVECEATTNGRPTPLAIICGVLCRDPRRDAPHSSLPLFAPSLNLNFNPTCVSRCCAKAEFEEGLKQLSAGVRTSDLQRILRRLNADPYLCLGLLPAYANQPPPATTKAYPSTASVPSAGPSDADVKKAWRRLALKYHPDKTQNRTSELFTTIKAAYALLADPTERAALDARGHRAREDAERRRRVRGCRHRGSQTGRGFSVTEREAPAHALAKASTVGTPPRRAPPPSPLPSPPLCATQTYELCLPCRRTRLGRGSGAARTATAAVEAARA